MIFGLLMISNCTISSSASFNKDGIYEDNDIHMRYIQLSAQQIASFYEGREFAKTAIDKLTSSCYVTVIIKNKTADILWIDLNEWVFTGENNKIERQTRSYWNKQWDEINLKQAHRSTFGWTLMPDVRDLYPAEGVGGRVPIPMQDKPFSVIFNFPTGKDRNGKLKTVRIDGLVCATNALK